MKNVVKVVVVLSMVFTMQSMTVAKGVTGTWVFEAPYAPYEYAEGEIVINKTKGVYSCELNFEYESLKIYEIKVDGNTIIAEFDMEGESIKITMKIKGDALSGVAETSEGDIEITAKRK